MGSKNIVYKSGIILNHMLWLACLTVMGGQEAGLKSQAYFIVWFFSVAAQDNYLSAFLYYKL